MKKKDLFSILSSFRYLFDDLSLNQDIVMRDIDSFTSYGDMIFPCDVIDLRTILSEMKIGGNNNIVSFSLKFAEKYLKEYPIFILVDTKKIETGKDYIGIKVFDKDVDISLGIKQVIINEPLPNNIKNRIINIIKETNNIKYSISNSIPGISSLNTKLTFTIDGNIIKESQTMELPEVRLNSKEKAIFNFLNEVKSQFNLNTEFRVAGGWIRDKILNIESDDIDIALSNMTGSELVSYIKQMPSTTNTVGRDYQVSANAEKSKHLETAGIDLFGQKVEFVNLRSESYGDTRVPTMEMGTPETDAERRDLTINALFYNIGTGQVEDYVGGLNDIRNGILRTPQDPVQTFKDDPLRILRALRFKSRFNNFQLSPDIIEAMKDPEVQESYKNKVSVERTGPEIMKMMKGDNPVESLRILFETDLYKSVFNVPEMEDINEDGIKMDQRTPWHKHNLMNHTLEVVNNLNNIMKEKGETDDMRGLMNLAALFHFDFGKMKNNIPTPHPKNPGQMQYIHHEKASERMADAILKSIGVGKDDRDIVNQVISLHMQPHSSDGWGDKEKGNFLRRSRMKGKEKEHKDLWKYIFYYAQADDMASQPDDYDDKKRQGMFNSFNDYVNSPIGSFRMSVLDGNDLKMMFPNLKPETGFIKEFLEIVQNLQDEGKIDMSSSSTWGKKNIPIEVKEQAKNALMSFFSIPGNGNIIKKYQEDNNTVAKNWYSKRKVAQTADMNFSDKFLDKEIIKGPKKNNSSSYEPGMRVRDRRKGIVVPQEFGIVKKIKDNVMIIEWHGSDKKEKREEKFDLSDTVKLHLIVAEI